MLILVDHANIQATFAYNDKRIDWEELRDYINNTIERTPDVREPEDSIFALFIGVPPDDYMFHDLRYKKMKFISYLGYTGFLVYTRNGIPTIRDGAVVSYRADTDLLMAIRGIELIQRYDPNHVVIITGDNDFCTLVEYIRAQGRRVTVAGISSWIGSALRYATNDVLDLHPLHDTSPFHKHQDTILQLPDTNVMTP